METEFRDGEERPVETARSGYGSVPGEEFPQGIYISVLAGFAWMLGAAWIAFGTNAGTDLDLVVITVLGVVFLSIPILTQRAAASRRQSVPLHLKKFLGSELDTATGPMPAWQAWLEVMLIPAALAVGATLIGAVYLLS